MTQTPQTHRGEKNCKRCHFPDRKGRSHSISPVSWWAEPAVSKSERVTVTYTLSNTTSVERLNLSPVTYSLGNKNLYRGIQAGVYTTTL